MRLHSSYGMALEVAATALIGSGLWFGWLVMLSAGCFWCFYGRRTGQKGLACTPLLTLPLNTFFAVKWGMR